MSDLAQVISQMSEIIARLERLNVITTDPDERGTCCGLPRDDYGQCINRPGHPIYVELS